MARKDGTRIVTGKDRGGRNAASGSASYIDLEQIKKRYAGKTLTQEDGGIAYEFDDVEPERAAGERAARERLIREQGEPVPEEYDELAEADEDDCIDAGERAADEPSPRRKKVSEGGPELDVFGEGESEKTVPKWAILGFLGLLLISALAGAYFLLLIDTIDVQGNETIEKADVLTIAGINTGEHLLLADISGARQALLADPRIRDARIERVYPDALVMTVEERKPVAAIIGSSSAAVIDIEGYVMEITDRAPEGMTAIYGASSAGFSIGGNIGEYSRFNSDTLLKLISAMSDAEIMDIIASIDISQPLMITMITTYGYTVNIGQPDDLADKFRYLDPVINKVMEMGHIGGTIDLGVLGDPVYAPPVTATPEPSPEPSPEVTPDPDGKIPEIKPSPTPAQPTGPAMGGSEDGAGFSG